MNKPSYQLRYTREFINGLNVLQHNNHQEFSFLKEQVLPNLCHYPLQGRLLLNREPSCDEAQRLRWQLVHRFGKHEVRELCSDRWLIIYLHHAPYLYLLALILFNDTFTEIIEIWGETL